jgi:hypothetical protein
VEVVTNGRKCSRQISISFVVAVTIGEVWNPTKSIQTSSQLSSKEVDD